MMNKFYVPIEIPFMFFYNKTTETKSSPLTPFHRHNAYEIFLFLGGNRKVCIDNQCFICEPGDLFLIGPETLHAGLCDEACEYERIVVNVKEDFLRQLSCEEMDFCKAFECGEKNPVKRIRLGYQDMKKIKTIYEDFENARKQSGCGQKLLTDTYILQLLILICRWLQQGDMQSRSDNIMPQVVSDVMAYIQDNLTEELTVESLSKKFYFQDRYLSKVLKKYTGLTLRTYILDCRIARAKKLLCEGYNVSEVCYKAGFNDYANFLRSFKKHVGISPGKYVSQRRNDIR